MISMHMMSNNKIRLNAMALVCALITGVWPSGASGAVASLVDRIKGEIDKVVAERGCAPSDKEYLGILRKMPKLTLEEHRAAYRYWAASQRVGVSRGDIAALIEAQRSSLYDLRVSYQTSYYRRSDSDGLVAKGRYDEESAKSGDKLFHKYMKSGFPGEHEFTRISAYDGKVVRTYSQVGQRREGTVFALDDRSLFCGIHSPLYAAMLIDSEPVYGQSVPSADIVSLLREDTTVVLEQKELVDGREVIVVVMSMPPMVKVYLDPKRDYAVLRNETFRKIGPQKEHLTSSTLYGVVKCEELEETGEGLWLPRKVTTEIYSTTAAGGVVVGTVIERRIMTSSEAAINKGVPDDVFVDIFPSGTKVCDAITGIEYIH